VYEGNVLGMHRIGMVLRRVGMNGREGKAQYMDTFAITVGMSSRVV
jgi:hypothetical protein